MLPAVSDSPSRDRLFKDLQAHVAALVTAPPAAVESVLPTGYAPLDAKLAGGVPLGSLVTCEGTASSGRWSLAASFLARATQKSLAAIVDDGQLYPPSLEAAGVRLDRLLIVPAKGPIGIARAVDMMLRSRVARVIVMEDPVLRDAVWRRLARLVHRAGAILVVIAAQAASALSAVATLRLSCAARPIVRGRRGLWGIFSALELHAEIGKQKSGFHRVRAGC